MTLIFILSIEVVLNILVYPKSVVEKGEDIIKKKVETLVSLLEDGKNASLSVPPRFLQEIGLQKNTDLFLSNPRNKIVPKCEEDEGMIIENFDENGFRNPTNLYTKTESFDLFLLGESHADGDCVADGYTIGDQIQKLGYYVYNAAKGGTGFIFQMAIFIEYGLAIKPKNLIMNIVEGVTLNRGMRELKDPNLKRYFDFFQSNNLLQKKSIQDEVLQNRINFELYKKFVEKDDIQSNVTFSYEEVYLKMFLNIRLVRMIKEHLGQQILGVGEGYPKCNKMEQGREAMKKVFQYLKTATAEYGGQFSISYMPATRTRPGYIEGSSHGIEPWPECEHEMIISLSKELNIPLIDVVEDIMKHETPMKQYYAKNQYYDSTPGHMNRNGYKLVAQKIVKFLKTTTDN